ncbi:hypothetical protein BKA69DRAFT_1126344 [Paraphysoderma sedebokerense]|nr:hypothetical protein BKA69DRAFT_1126344 [Paraphysoderma sedebokerense]
MKSFVKLCAIFMIVVATSYMMVLANPLTPAGRPVNQRNDASSKPRPAIHSISTARLPSPKTLSVKPTAPTPEPEI